MSIANEVLSYIRTLIWPALVAAVLIGFRSEIRKVILRLRSLPTPWGPAEFGQEAIRLAETGAMLADEVAPQSSVRLSASPTPIHADPTGAFLDAYRSLDSTSRDVAGLLKLRRAQPAAVVAEMVKRNLLPDEAGPLAERLRDIRNQVAHGQLRLQPADAENLVEASASLRSIMQAGASSGSMPRQQ